MIKIILASLPLLLALAVPGRADLLRNGDMDSSGREWDKDSGVKIVTLNDPAPGNKVMQITLRSRSDRYVKQTLYPDRSVERISIRFRVKVPAETLPDNVSSAFKVTVASEDYDFKHASFPYPPAGQWKAFEIPNIPVEPGETITLAIYFGQGSGVVWLDQVGVWNTRAAPPVNPL